MDVTHRELPPVLGKMLEALTKAHFVSLDFELSGIASKVAFKEKGVGSGEDSSQSRKQTLQQRYNEAREAATKYQILQVGITIVEESEIRDGYIVRPFNFFLNPCFNERLDIERDFCFNSSAMDFLLYHGFRIDSLFRDGVPYLSREEQAQAVKKEAARLNGDAVPDIHLGADELDAIAFVKKARANIESWIRRRKPNQPDDRWVVGICGSDSVLRPLNAFQRRLVHQLVRAEFKEYITVPGKGFIYVKPYDAEREDKIRDARFQSFMQRISRQVGLRWVIEAMAGGNLEGLDPTSLIQRTDGNPVWIDAKKVGNEFEITRNILSTRRTVLVGHNVFVDLVNLYRCFIGPLPERVEDFQRAIHALFPLIIDTKYIATQKTGNMSSSSLEELDAEAAAMEQPGIHMDYAHAKYNATTRAHEAGYDSYSTARILIRFATRLHALGKWQEMLGETQDEEYHTPSESLHEAAHADLDLRLVDITNNRTPGFFDRDRPSSDIATKEDDGAVDHKRKGKKKKRSKEGKQAATKYSTTNRYDLLIDDVLADDVLVDDVDEDSKENVSSRDADGKDAARDSSEQPAREEALKRMPPWESGFWTVYGNKLRVFGTEEGLCKLGDD